MIVIPEADHEKADCSGKNAMKLYFMRHGETNYNRLGLCNDEPTKPVYLSETGIRQAEQARDLLADVTLDQIIVSELPRTRQTAEIVRGQRDIPILVHSALNDIQSGHEGLPVAAYFKATGHDRLHIRPANGESVLDFKSRVLPFIDWLATKPWKHALVVVHEETLRILFAYFNKLDDGAMLDLHFANCQIVQVDL
jgi:probable phosphoglycerate mutase